MITRNIAALEHQASGVLGWPFKHTRKSKTTRTYRAHKDVDIRVTNLKLSVLKKKVRLSIDTLVIDYRHHFSTMVECLSVLTGEVPQVKFFARGKLGTRIMWELPYHDDPSFQQACNTLVSHTVLIKSLVEREALVLHNKS